MQCCSLNYWCLGAIWYVIASGLVFYTWNKVICPLFNAKPLHIWQAFLLVLTIAVLQRGANTNCYQSCKNLITRSSSDFPSEMQAPNAMEQ